MKCEICGANAESTRCFRHKLRKPLSAGKKMSSFSNNKLKKAGINTMREFFLDIWRKRPHVSEISGTFLGNEPLSIFFHHILPKNKREYLQAKYDPENIILLTLDEHSNVEMDMYRYETINKRREKLLIKYNL